MSDTDPSYIGRGIAFPMGVDHTGSIRTSTGVEDIDRSIRVVLSTAPGERVMRPAFGCKIWELMFESINASTLGLMEEAVREALVRWEPRIDIVTVNAEPDAASQGAVRIGIAYRVKVTNDRRNLVYPFYMIPGEGEDPTEDET
ncbi:MAG: GPW/gp25 family protein [Ilumatobacteraceae bacterium]